jgi:hypothetical protein
VLKTARVKILGEGVTPAKIETSVSHHPDERSMATAIVKKERRLWDEEPDHSTGEISVFKIPSHDAYIEL